MSDPVELADWEWDLLAKPTGCGCGQHTEELEEWRYDFLFSEDRAGRKYFNISPNYRVEQDFTYQDSGVPLGDGWESGGYQRITTWRVMRVGQMAWEMDSFYSQADAVEVARAHATRRSVKVREENN